MHWLDVEEIAEALNEAHPKVDPTGVRFTQLRALVEGLPGFAAKAGHPCNEKILETIQALWIEEREECGGGGACGDDAEDDE